MDIVKNLDEVHDDVLPLFVETARALVAQKKGDAEKALCTALAQHDVHEACAQHGVHEARARASPVHRAPPPPTARQVRS